MNAEKRLSSSSKALPTLSAMSMAAAFSSSESFGEYATAVTAFFIFAAMFGMKRTTLSVPRFAVSFSSVTPAAIEMKKPGFKAESSE